MHVLADSWLHIFKPFTTFHLVVAFFCFALMAAGCLYGANARGTRAEGRFRVRWAVSVMAFQLFADIWRLCIRAGEPPDGNLPLQICRIAPWIAGIALLTLARPWRAILYFWGMGLCLHGFITPMRFEPTPFGSGGLSSVDFWLFWVGHFQIVGSAIYDLIVLRFRPTLADLRTALFASGLYAATIIPLNLTFDWNYGYLGRGPYRTRNIIDHLPAWPWRPACLIIVASLWLIALWAVWRTPIFMRKLRGRDVDAPSESARATS